MTIFECFKTKNLDELVEWFDAHYTFDDAPWWKWWDKNYCNKCEPEKVYVESMTRDIDLDREVECAWCEINGKCKFFKEIDDIPAIKQIIKMWLLSECE